MGFFKSLKNEETGFRLKPMRQHHVEAALTIIYDHDEDDGDAAAQTFQGDLSAFHVVEIDQQLAGLMGYARIMDAPTSAWLSWTYVAEAFRQQGVGTYMVTSLSQILKRKKVERLFIATSDYTEDGIDQYASARRFYERLGARCDLKIDDFYQPGEAKYIYRLSLGGEGFGDGMTAMDEAVRFIDIEPIDETDGAFALIWEPVSRETPEADPPLSHLIDAAKNEGGHAVFASLPYGYSSGTSTPLQSAGFRQLGSVTDYYGVGQNDIYWGLSLTSGR
ncbi:MAG: GNAT family N-acetyltransferase [Pseudomonadota bacterium]